MSHLTTRGWSVEDARELRARSAGPHTVQWRASVSRWSRGREHVLCEALPLTGGKLTLDSSDPTRRQLTLELAAAGSLVPIWPNDPLAPFGQIVKLYCRIDRFDGSWLPWLKQGEFPLQTTSSEWPSLIQTLTCADYSSTVDAYLHEHKRSYNGRTVYSAIKAITESALPNRAFAIHATAESRRTSVEKHTVAEAGSSRWETAVDIAQARGMETFFDWNGDLVIRDDITQDDDESIPGVGPDIGTVSNPVAVIKDGPSGNLVALTVSVTREGAANGVFITLHETADQKARRKGHRDRHHHYHRGRLVSGDKRVNVLIQALAKGTIAWGDKFGRVPIVLERNVHVITDDIIKAQKRRAKRLLRRRGGVIRTVDLDAVGCYHVEPDDRIRIEYDGTVESHFVSSIEFDLSGKSPARLRTRTLNTPQPG